MRNSIEHKLRVWNLRSFLSISLGLHLGLVSAAFIVFPEFKIVQLPDRTIEVSFLPMVAEEKPPPAMIPPKIKPEIKKEEIRPPQPQKKEEPLPQIAAEEKPPPAIVPPEIKPEIRKEGMPPPPIQRKEEPLPQKEAKPELPPPVQVAEKKIAVEEPKPLPKKEEPKPPPQREEAKPLTKEEPKPHPRREEPNVLVKEEPKPLPLKSLQEKGAMEPGPAQAVTLATPRDTGPSTRKEENPFSFRLASSKGDHLSLPLPSGPSKEITGNPSPDNGSHQGLQRGEKSSHREATSEGSQGGSMNVASLAPPSDGKIAFAQPKYDKNPKPLYPPEAQKRGLEGEVLLRVEVLSNGRVGQVEVNRSSGHEILDRSALAAVKQWEFVPAKKGETVVSQWVRIPIPFRLKTNKTIVVIDGRSR